MSLANDTLRKTQADVRALADRVGIYMPSAVDQKGKAPTHGKSWSASQILRAAFTSSSLSSACPRYRYILVSVRDGIATLRVSGVLGRVARASAEVRCHHPLWP